MLFWGHVVQDGWLNTMVWNLCWSISLHWLKILTSILKKVYSESYQKLQIVTKNYWKIPKITENYWKLQETVRYGLLITGQCTLFINNMWYILKVTKLIVTRYCQNWPKITEKGQTLPKKARNHPKIIFVHNFALD